MLIQLFDASRVVGGGGKSPQGSIDAFPEEAWTHFATQLPLSAARIHQRFRRPLDTCHAYTFSTTLTLYSLIHPLPVAASYISYCHEASIAHNGYHDEQPKPALSLPRELCRFRQYHLTDREEARQEGFPVQYNLCWYVSWYIYAIYTLQKH